VNVGERGAASCKRERGDVPAAQEGGREGDIQEAERDGGTGVWDNKTALGFRQFPLKGGLEKVNLEGEIVCLGYNNLKRLYQLSQG
jgi:hypothetical protein